MCHYIYYALKNLVGLGTQGQKPTKFLPAVQLEPFDGTLK